MNNDALLEEFILRHRVASMLSLITKKFSVMDLDIVLSDTDYLNNIIRDIAKVVNSHNKKDDIKEHLDDLVSFSINQPINEFLKSWVEAIELYEYIPGIEQQVLEYLYSNNEQLFYSEDSLLSVADLAIVWDSVSHKSIEQMRLYALVIFYIITRNLADNEAFSEFLNSVRFFFAIRSYLLGEAPLPAKEMSSYVEYVLVEAKGLLTSYEAMILKSITAASGTAMALNREDLESKRVPRIEESKKKRYNRIESLEE